jgi:hypothetical protein
MHAGGAEEKQKLMASNAIKAVHAVLHLSSNTCIIKKRKLTLMPRVLCYVYVLMCYNV